ncbi:MAG: ORC1-type DNA replication protein [Methanolinea sp.]|nr:ORC1-type DNA replication protein [Methanolinea sp.]
MAPVIGPLGNSVFRDREVLEADFLPEEILFRDSQLREIAYCLQPGLHGGRPVNALLRGPPGTGKTTCVRRIFAEVEEATRKIVPVHVHCQGERTLHAVLSRIHTAIYGHAPPALGSPVREVLDRIGKGLAAEKRVLSVCLDDANLLLAGRVLDQVLSALLRLHEAYPGARAGVLLVVGNPGTDLSRALDPAVVSVLYAAEIPFSPYAREEVAGILRDRARRALLPGVLPGDVLDLVVEKTVSCGDLRVGIDLLRRAALAAERAGDREITAGHVEAAFEASRDARLEDCVEALSGEEREILLQAARLVLAEPGVPLTAGLLFDAVTMRVRMSYAAFHQRVRRLEEAGAIAVRARRTAGRGRTREIHVRFDPARVVSACGGNAGACPGQREGEEAA